jgi:hypothetical protein
MDSDLSLSELNQHIGTTQYHKLPLLDEFNLTDGVVYVMSNGYSWFITDVLSVIKCKLNNEEFLSVDLKLLDDNKAKMIITDGNENELYTQDYEYTDGKKEFKLFFTNGVLMLSNEY